MTNTTLNVKDRIEQLTNELNDHCVRYHVDGCAIIDDPTYDRLYQDLLRLEMMHPEYRLLSSPTKAVGQLDARKPKFKHTRKMLSLSNVFNESEMRAWIEKAKTRLGKDTLSFSVEDKYDGIAVSLRYVDGVLKTMLTRGDGEHGHLIEFSPNVVLEAIPKTKVTSLTGNFVVHGELVISRDQFDLLNTQRGIMGDPTYSHQRNAVAGIIRSSNAMWSAVTLTFIPYGIHVDNHRCRFWNYQEQMKELASMGFSTVNKVDRIYTDSIDDIMAFYWKAQKEHRSSNIATDGIVIKISDTLMQIELGESCREPRWATAFKFPAIIGETTLIDVQWQVGRTGIITPVAILNPIALSGALIERVSLHNPRNIHNLGVHLGCRVCVVRSGEVIPKIIHVVDAGTDKFQIPEQCPSCGGATEQLQGGLGLRCSNYNNDHCRDRCIAELEYFVSKEVFDIDGMGRKTLEVFYDRGLAKTPNQLYTLYNHRQALIELDGFGEKTVDHLLRSIELSKETSYPKFIQSLAIPGVSIGIAISLTRHFKTIGKLMTATYDELRRVSGIGDTLAKNIRFYFTTAERCHAVLQRIDAGVKWKEPDTLDGLKYKNTRWGFTGRLRSHSRNVAIEQIEKLGAIHVSSNGGNLQFLVIGENAKPRKIEKARANGAQILTEADFKDIVTKTPN